MENIDYSQLSAEEYEKIMYVLKRDEKLRRQEEQRLFHLKAELHRLRKRGAIKPGMDQSRVCARCLNELGRLLNRGAICPVCRKTVCKSCRSTSNDENLWLCLVCHKQMQLKAASGEWMREFSRSASEKLRSPSSRSPINHSSSTSGGTESFGKSIKQSLISGFSTSPNTSRTQLCEDYERQPVRQQPQIPYSYVQQTQASIQPQAFVPHPPQPYQMLPTSPQHPPLALHASCPPYTQQPPSPHHPIPTHQYSAPASFMQPQAPFQPLPPQPFLQQHASFQQQQPLTAFPQTQIHPQSQQSFHNHNHHLPPIPQQSPHHHPSVQPPSQTAPDPPRNPSPKASSTRRQLPPKLPSVDCSARAPLQRSSSNNSSGGSQETSPKPPISPVLKAAYQAAVDLVERKKDSVSPPYNSNLKEPKETVYRKVSTRLQDSSSSEEEEEEEASGAASLYGVKSIDSSPSPRTPNSYKILSSVAHNQATAFKFPPSPYSSRPSSQSRQSSDEISTTFSSLISRSTSSDNNEDPNATSPGNPPNAMARVRRMSMLVKQQAIAEEFNNEISSTVQKLADATNVSRTDSGLSDSNYTSSPRSSSSRAGNRGSGGSEQLFWRTSPKKKNSTGSSGGLGVNDSDDSDDSSENNSSDTVEKTTGYIFRKVTAKRRVSRNETSPESGNQENGSHMRSPSPSIQGNSTRSASGGSSDGNSRGSNSRTSPAKSPTKSPAKTATSLMGDPRSLIGGGPVYKSKSQGLLVSTENKSQLLVRQSMKQSNSLLTLASLSSLSNPCPNSTQKPPVPPPRLHSYFSDSNSLALNTISNSSSSFSVRSDGCREKPAEIYKHSFKYIKALHNTKNGSSSSRIKLNSQSGNNQNNHNGVSNRNNNAKAKTNCQSNTAETFDDDPLPLPPPTRRQWERRIQQRHNQYRPPPPPLPRVRCTKKWKIKNIGNRVREILADRLIPCRGRIAKVYQKRHNDKWNKRWAQKMAKYQNGATRKAFTLRVERTDRVDNCWAEVPLNALTRSTSLPDDFDEIYLNEGFQLWPNNKLLSGSIERKLNEAIEKSLPQSVEDNQNLSVRVKAKTLVPLCREYQIAFLNGENKERKLEGQDGQGTTEADEDDDLNQENKSEDLKRLKVKSRIQIISGTVCVEDSDWEMCSDFGGDQGSSFYGHGGDFSGSWRNKYATIAYNERRNGFDGRKYSSSSSSSSSFYSCSSSSSSTIKDDVDKDDEGEEEEEEVASGTREADSKGRTTAKSGDGRAFETLSSPDGPPSYRDSSVAKNVADIRNFFLGKEEKEVEKEGKKGMKEDVQCKEKEGPKSITSRIDEILMRSRNEKSNDDGTKSRSLICGSASKSPSWKEKLAENPSQVEPISGFVTSNNSNQNPPTQKPSEGILMAEPKKNEAQKRMNSNQRALTRHDFNQNYLNRTIPANSAAIWDANAQFRKSSAPLVSNGILESKSLKLDSDCKNGESEEEREEKLVSNHDYPRYSQHLLGYNQSHLDDSLCDSLLTSEEQFFLLPRHDSDDEKRDLVSLPPPPPSKQAESLLRLNAFKVRDSGLRSRGTIHLEQVGGIGNGGGGGGGSGCRSESIGSKEEKKVVSKDGKAEEEGAGGGQEPVALVLNNNTSEILVSDILNERFLNNYNHNRNRPLVEVNDDGDSNSNENQIKPTVPRRRRCWNDSKPVFNLSEFDPNCKAFVNFNQLNS